MSKGLHSWDCGALIVRLYSGGVKIVGKVRAPKADSAQYSYEPLSLNNPYNGESNGKENGK